MAAITSAFPALYSYRVALCVMFVFLVMVANLWGVRETGRILALPTYWFILCLALLVGGGFYRLLTQGAPPPPQAIPIQEPLTAFLILRAFSGGCAALTGTEAVANGVQYFRPPESRNAGITLIWMASILAVSFLGSRIWPISTTSCHTPRKQSSPCWDARSSVAGWSTT